MKILFVVSPVPVPIEIKGFEEYVPKKGEFVVTRSQLFVVDKTIWKPALGEVHIFLLPEKE